MIKNLFHLLISSILLCIAGFSTAEENQSGDSARFQLDTLEIYADVDKVQSIQSYRVGASEGAQSIGEDYIRAQQSSTLADALRKTTSIQIDEEGGQQGTRVYIRGFTQDQISIRVEGAPKNFNQVRHGGADTIWLEPDMYKSISVIPGVASNVYGNGSLGGIVLLETLDPEDLIKPGEDYGLRLRGGIESNARSYYTSLSGAQKLSDWLSLSSTYVRRDTNQYKDGNGNKALLGSTGSYDNNLLLKAVITPDVDGDHRAEILYTGLRKDYTARTTMGSGAYTDPSQIEVEDNTYTLEYSWSPKDNQYWDLNFRVSRAETERWRLTEGSSTPTIWGVKTNYVELGNVSTFFQSDEIVHQLRYGVDYTFDDVRTAYGNLGAERTQQGVYISDTLFYGENLSFVASLRYDKFENAVDKAQAIDKNAVSPKLFVNWKPFEDSAVSGLGVYGVIGKGFRAPSVHEARSDNEASCGRRGCSIKIANSGLKGESSDSWEAGIRYDRSNLLSEADQLNIKLSYVNNKAKNYITSVLVRSYREDMNGDGRPDKVDVNQYRNVGKAEIDGVELSVNYTSENWFGALSTQNIDGKYTSGTYKGQKLPDISPATTNFTIGTYLFGGRSRVGMDVSHRATRKYIQRRINRVRKGYTIYDIFASWQFNEQLTAQFRVENLFDELYSKRAIAKVDGEDITTYAPGRNIKLTFNYEF